MTAIAKIEANRKNAKLSTGPKTPTGKATARLNAVAHGLRSMNPVLPGEAVNDWDAHRAGTAAALAPVGALEAELADRVALLTWRLRRVLTYETAKAAEHVADAEARARGESDSAGMFESLLGKRPTRTQKHVRDELDHNRDALAAANDHLAALRALPGRDDREPLDADDAYSLLWALAGCSPDEDDERDPLDAPLLARIGVPAEWRDAADEWDGWTVGVVRKGVAAIAQAFNTELAQFLTRAERTFERDARLNQQHVVRLTAELSSVEATTATAVQSVRQSAALLLKPELEKVMRYESHLNRQLVQTLHLLERLQALRGENPPTPPVAIDVTIDAGTGGLDPAG